MIMGLNKNLISKDLKAIGISNDNIVEYYSHKKYNISGIMWHPERNKKYKKS